MRVEIFPVGMLQTNCYVVNCEKTLEAIIIDPGFDYRSEATQILDYIEAGKLKVKFIVNTHNHSDHINGDATMQEHFKVPVCIHLLDASEVEVAAAEGIPETVLLKDGDNVEFGRCSLKVMHTPGHTPGSICLVGEEVIFSGDTLFAGSIGRTDFPESSSRDMESSLRKFLDLPDGLVVYSGHGEVSVLGSEKRFNPFLVDL